MGDWNLTIRGTGAHHNGKPYDAEQLAAGFVKKLKEQGQTVHSVNLVSGDHTDVLALAPLPEVEIPAG